MKQGKNIYFISDAHLGTPDPGSSHKREKQLVRFLEQIEPEASEIFFLGDLFDFWFEYKRVIPRGFTRLLGKLSHLADSGIKLHFFTGNHDIWTFDYLQTEIGMIIYREPTEITLGDKRFFMAHGDGLDKKDKSFRIIKWIFTNRLLQWMFARLHPNFAIWLAESWSRRSRQKHGADAFKEESEPLVKYSRQHLLQKDYDYIIFGHRHCPVDYPLNEKTHMIILGDWMSHFTYAIFDGEELKLKTKD